LYLAGQVSLDPETGKVVEGDIKAHVTQALKNIEGVLKAADMDFSNVVSAQVFLTNVDDFSAMNEVYRSVVKQPLPARVPIGVPKLALGAPVEINMIASRHKGKAILPPDMMPSSNYSRGLLVDNTLYVSGVASTKDTVKEQVDDCLGRVEKIVKEAGMSMQDLVEARVYLTDIKDYGPMNNAYRNHFSFPNSATRATMAVSKLPGNNKIMMAFVGAKREK
jgi:2-iminobutanoate/2-iminopropanoate deaminase